jgi:ABC-type multidrug transport system fused ATPase/permease subunit
VAEARPATSAGGRDLAELRRPVLGRIVVAAVVQGLAAALSVAPMVAVVEIGRRLLAGQHSQLWPIAFVAIGLLAARLALYVLAGVIGHLADAELAGTLRGRLAETLAVLPLRWFAGGVSAKVKTVVQDDVAARERASRVRLPVNGVGRADRCGWWRRGAGASWRRGAQRSWPR